MLYVAKRAGIDPNEEVVRFAEGLDVPRRGSATVTGDRIPCDVRIEVVLEDGRLVAESVTCERRRGGPPVTTEMLRAIPVAEALRLAILKLLEARSSETFLETFRPRPEEITRRGPTDEALRSLAVMYRVAFLMGESPTNAVAVQLKLPRSTAGRWVRMARDKGFLGPAEPRRAGERTGNQRPKGQ